MKQKRNMKMQQKKHNVRDAVEEYDYFTVDDELL